MVGNLFCRKRYAVPQRYQSAIGGSQIEAWTPNTGLGKCRNESLNANGQAPPARFFNGMVAPFVNFSLAGFVWYQVIAPCLQE